MGVQILIADIDAYDPALPGVVTLRFATQGYATGPADSPAHTFYDGRIVQRPSVTRSLFAGAARTFGRTQVSYGDMVLANNDGGLDALIGYGFAGRAVTLRVGEQGADGTVASWSTVFTGVMEQAVFSWTRVTLRLRDRQQDIAKPLQGNRYGGTNALPNGLDGVPDDIQGEPKPLVYGKVLNIMPPCVNTTRLIYQLHDGSALQSVDGVYDRGVPLTAGATYASQAAMETTAPAAGQYRTWNSAAGCYIRLGSQPAGTLTADASQGAAAANRTAGQLWSQVLQKAGVSGGSISAADITALDTAANYVLGVYVGPDSDTSAIEVLDMLAASVGAWYGPDVAGLWRIKRVAAPSGAGVCTLTTLEVLSIERLVSQDPGLGIPAYQVTVQYAPLWAVQVDLAAAVSADRSSFLAKEYRKTVASDAAVLTVYPTSPALTFKTLINTAANAGTERDRLLALYKVRRDMLQVSVRADAATGALLVAGAVLKLALPRYAMTAGKAFLVVSVSAEYRTGTYTLTLWG